MKAITTKQDLITSLQKQVGYAGYMSWPQIAKYMAVSKNNKTQKAKFTFGLRYIEDGRGRRYRIVDVAERLQEIESIEIERYES